MKQSIKWILALVMGSGMAYAYPDSYQLSSSNGCGCLTERKARLAPVREMVVEKKLYTVQRPLVVRESTCLAETSRPLGWGAPFRAAGTVVSAPFVALGNAFSPSEQMIEPVGERVILRSSSLEPVGEKITYKTTSHKWSKKHLRKVTWIRNDSMLLPVGERFTTVRTYHRPLLMPVGERFSTVKVIHHRRILEPVGERITTVRYIQPQSVLEPIGERITTTRYIKMKPVLMPVGERTIIRTTRTFSNSWSPCDY